MIVSLLQWNVWVHEDISNVVAELKRFDADIICLQELTRNFEGQAETDTVDFVGRGLGYYYAEAEIVHAGETWQQANAIYSRYPILHSNTSWIREPLAPVAEETGETGDQFRAYVEAAIETGGGQLTVGTTHMSYDHQFGVTLRKQQEADKLVELSSVHPEKYVLTGDFNELPESYTVRRLTERLRNAGPPYDAATWTTKRHDFGDVTFDKLQWRLDYVFASPDLRVVSADILQTQYSDHLPILVRLELNH